MHNVGHVREPLTDQIISDEFTQNEWKRFAGFEIPKERRDSRILKIHRVNRGLSY